MIYEFIVRIWPKAPDEEVALKYPAGRGELRVLVAMRRKAILYDMLYYIEHTVL